jgi:uncharacterized protein (UPF0276 family)
VDPVVVDVEDAVVAKELIEIPQIGVGYRAPIAKWIVSRPREINCLEITAEHFFDHGHDRLRELSEFYPLYVHGLGLSLGTPGPIEQETLNSFCKVAEIANPEWVSEHISFTKCDEVDLGHLNPIPCTEDSLRTLIDHSREVMDRCQKRLVLENVTTFLQLKGHIPETEFINRLCDTAGVGLLLDVTNLLINSRNHEFDPLTWLREIEHKHIVQLHIVGYSFENGVWQDYHAEPIQDDLLELMQDVVEYAPVQSIIVERDARFPPVNELATELTRLETACETARLR